MFNGYVDGCNCCETAKIDLFNSKSTYTEICEGESNIQVPCSCLNDENKVSACSCTRTSDCLCMSYMNAMQTLSYVHICHICTYVIQAVAANICLCTVIIMLLKYSVSKGNF